MNVRDEYINYLRTSYPNVYSNKQETRVHTRRYVGVVINVEDYNYYIPLSSPKETDFQVAGDSKVNHLRKCVMDI